MAKKRQENRTNMDIILLFLAKPLDKHGITLVRITYRPLGTPAFYSPFICSSLCRISNPSDSKFWGIPDFCKTLVFSWILVKIHKSLGKFTEFRSGSMSIYHRISSVVHVGYVDIFWNTPLSPRKSTEYPWLPQAFHFGFDILVCQGLHVVQPFLNLFPLMNGLMTCPWRVVWWYTESIKMPGIWAQVHPVSFAQIQGAVVSHKETSELLSLIS